MSPTSSGKHSLDTGTTSTRDEVFAAACVTLGVPLKHDTPGVDNVYDKDKPYTESAGGKYAGTVNYYLALKAPNGILTGGLLKYWEDPMPVEDEMRNFPVQLASANTTELRRVAANSLRELIPCVAMIWMRKACKETPRAAWHHYGEPTELELRSWDELDEAPIKVAAGEFKVSRLGYIFVPAMHAAVKTCILNALDLESMRKSVSPSIKIERPTLPSIPFVMQMTPGWRERFMKLNPLGKKKRTR